MYNTNSQIKFKTLMPKSSSCGYCNAYILIKRIITVAQVPARSEPGNIGKNIFLHLLIA